ncbi:MAG: DUF5806 family protein [Halobacteriaceae archaeon]
MTEEDTADDASASDEGGEEPTGGGGPERAHVAESHADGPGTDAGSGSNTDTDVGDGSGVADGAETEGESADGTRAVDPGEPSGDPGTGGPADAVGGDSDPGVPEDVQRYDRFQKVDGAQYERVNEFLRDRTYITAREWAIARLCADFRTETGVEMTKIGENLPDLVPFMTDTYSPQAVNQARAAFEEKVHTAGATFLYGAMCDFFTADELDDLMYEATEVAKFLLEVEGVDLAVEEELDAEDRISTVMREVRHASDQLRHEGAVCPECGHEFDPGERTAADGGTDR